MNPLPGNRTRWFIQIQVLCYCSRDDRAIGSILLTADLSWQLRSGLGGYPRIESLLRKGGLWPDSPLILVKYNEYSPQIRFPSLRLLFSDSLLVIW